MTGSNTGIGKVTALELARKGAHVIITSRDSVKGKATVLDITSKLEPNTVGKVTLEMLDLSSLKDTAKFSAGVLQKYGKKKLDILILNVRLAFKD